MKRERLAVLQRANEIHDEVVSWRHEMHRRPEIGFELGHTAARVAALLRGFGCDQVVEGVGTSGVVAVIEGARGPGGTIGLRADMDALPIREAGGAAYASAVEGAMHACGHDGHTAMLLGAAKCLCERRAFGGRVVLVFQPAEEIGQGAKAMLADGLLQRFGIERIYGMHNMPGIPTGRFAICAGPIMAAVAKFTIRVRGRGGHAARPHTTVDPLLAGAQIVTGLQTFVSRIADPVSAAVVSVTRFSAGSAYNIIPEEVEIWGTTRALDMAVAAEAEAAVTRIATETARAAGAEAQTDYDQAHPATVNDAREAEFAASIARQVSGNAPVDTQVRPVMAGEDFSHMLNACRGAYVFLGNGNSAGLHHPEYDFDDAAIPAGISYWVELAEAALAQRS